MNKNIILSRKKLKSPRQYLKKGFTLIEILVVMAMIGILAGFVILIINPTSQLGNTRNAQRTTDVNTILNAVYQYAIDNNGTLPTTISLTSTEICETNICTGLVDLSVLTINEKYLAVIPAEPQKTNANGAGYMIKKTANGRITVEAQFEELGKTISATR